MRIFQLAAVALVGLAALGCASERVPTAPQQAVVTPPPPPPSPAAPLPPLSTGPGSLWVMVMEQGGSGACIEGATVQTVSAEGLGQPIRQITPCDYWGDYGGVLLENLNPEVDVRLRGAANGYESRDISFRPFRDGLTVKVLALTPLK